MGHSRPIEYLLLPFLNRTMAARPSAYSPTSDMKDGGEIKGIFCHIADSSAISDHTIKAVDLDFSLAKDPPYRAKPFRRPSLSRPLGAIPPLTL